MMRTYGIMRARRIMRAYVTCTLILLKVQLCKDFGVLVSILTLSPQFRHVLRRGRDSIDFIDACPCFPYSLIDIVDYRVDILPCKNLVERL